MVAAIVDFHGERTDREWACDNPIFDSFNSAKIYPSAGLVNLLRHSDTTAAAALKEPRSLFLRRESPVLHRLQMRSMGAHAPNAAV